jgi:hypothetical protein
MILICSFSYTSGKSHHQHMGKRTPIRPGFTASLVTMIAAAVRCRAMCGTCSGWRELDLTALAAKIGPDATLWNKRTRCRITEGCGGINRFYYDGRGRLSSMRNRPPA